MYKKSAVLKAGNYQHALLMEDTLLSVNMILSGAKCANVDDYLVFARTGKTGYISYFDYLITIAIQFIVAIIPNKLRKFVFEKLLHS